MTRSGYGCICGRPLESYVLPWVGSPSHQPSPKDGLNSLETVLRIRTLSVAGVSAGALILAATVAGSADARTHRVTYSHSGGFVAHHIVPMKKGNCYSNFNSKNDSGVGILSQTFTDSPEYNSYSADNFAVKKTCKVAGVEVLGQYFNGAGPAESETVTFYKDNAGGVPGTVVDSQTVVGTDYGGSFSIPLETVALSPGSYWVSVSVNMDFSVGGEWGWELSNKVKQGIEGQFENTGGGFGVCPTWGSVTDCVGYTGDFMVTLTK